MDDPRQYVFEQRIKAYLKRAGLTQVVVADRLNYTPAQFNKWLKSVNRMPDVVVLELGQLLDLTPEEQRDLFTLAGYVAVTDLSLKTGIGTGPGGIRRFFGQAWRAWSEDVFRWSQASEYDRSSWAGLILYGLRAITNHLTPRGFLIVWVSILLGFTAVQLLSPVLLWPQPDPQARQLAFLLYGLATWLIPFLVAWVTPLDQPNLFPLTTLKQRLTFWVLKFAGALVGFWVFSALSLGISLTLYYLWPPLLVAPLRAILALIPLFFSYLAARRIPRDRYQMFQGELRLHPADRLFLLTFIFIGPLTALFFYGFYWFFADRLLAPPVILAVLIGMTWWHYRQRDQSEITDPVPADED